MKKLLLLAVFGALVAGLQAQNPFAVYQSDKTTGVTAHTFGASATTISLTQGARLDSLWIDKNGLSSDMLTATPTTRRDNIEIGFDFSFAGKTMQYCGLTAAGIVFFGEKDSLAPAVKISDQFSTQASDYTLFQLRCLGSKLPLSWLAKPLTAGENACVRYEKVADTLFIAYENLQAVDKQGNLLTISFQYAFDKSGKLSFRPVSMEPEQANTSEGAYYWGYSWGLVAQKGSSFRFLKATDGTSQQNGRAWIDLTRASHPLAGESYNFFLPPACVEVTHPQVNWDYDVQANSLRLNPTNAMTWNAEASAALFILSQKSSLTEDEDLPVNGTVYTNGSTIGSSVFVTRGEYNAASKKNYFQKGNVDGLSANTLYYLHAFPYITSCLDGPQYNTTAIPSTSFRTYYKEPASVRVGELTDTSAVLQITVDAAATRYLLAFDTLQLPQDAGLKLDETRSYAAGDKITFGQQSLTVLEPCAAAPSFAWKGLEQGKDYYAYVWSVNAERDWYSGGATLCGISPVRTLPATIGFASAAPVASKAERWNLPAGWEEETGNTYAYALREDTSHLKMLSVQSTYESETKASRSVLLSPYVDRGEHESVKATVELVYWAQSGNEMVPAKPTSGDTLIVEYPVEDGQWREVARVGASAAVQQDGTCLLALESFTPKKIFRLRFTVRSTTPTADIESEDRATPYVGIRALTLSPSSCKAATNLQVVDGSLTSTGVTLAWKDENNIPPLEYGVLYKEASETDWNVYPVNRPRAELTDLRAGGSYTVMVRSYCVGEDSALSQKITFTISSCAVPTSVRASHLQATSVDLSWRGNGLGYAVIYAPRVGEGKADTLRTEETSVTLTGLTPNTPYSAYVISYCGPQYTLPSDPSTTVYFNTPVSCTAPELEVVEGSVTWQGVWFTIKAPVLDRQIRILTKDNLNCSAGYEIVSHNKDTVKLYGLIDCENVTYTAMARSLCTVDTSEWSRVVEFTTLPVPECGEPSDLRARMNADGRTATVSWTAGVNNQSWLLMHKEKSAQRYDSLEVRETSSTFYGLKPNTVYTWRVQSACDRYLYSKLVYGEFSTSDVSLASVDFAENLRMRVDANQIEIENADGVYIKTLEVISMNGKRLRTYTINSIDNVLIPHTLPFGPAVFRITGEGGRTAVYKMMIP